MVPCASVLSVDVSYGQRGKGPLIAVVKDEIAPAMTVLIEKEARHLGVEGAQLAVEEEDAVPT